jgi:hypothetical protein
MYCRGLGFRVIGSFEEHDGFDGVMLGVPGAGYHFEFTRSRGHPVTPSPTAEDLVVFYIPSEAEWQATCGSMLAAGFRHVPAANPYWEARGRTFADVDGYRVVLERAAWTNAPLPRCNARYFKANGATSGDSAASATLTMPDSVLRPGFVFARTLRP